MNIKKILAAATASVLAVSAMAVVASAAPVLTTTISGESAKPADNVWELNIADYDAETLAKVDKVVISVTTTAYANGGMGGNTISADGWSASPQGENGEAGTNDWVWEGVGGLKKGLDEEGNETGYFKAEVWWQNVNDDGTDSTLTFNKIDFMDAEGNVLITLGEAAAPAPAGDESKDEESSEDTSPAESTGDENKDPVETGVGGVAAVLGVAVVAAGAMVVAKKRK